jgi:hypothetical protein
MPNTHRYDLKCGKGSISAGEKCTKGSAQAAPAAPGGRRTYPRRSLAQKALKTAGIASMVGGTAYALGGLARGRVGHAYGGLTAINAGGAALNYSSALEAERKGQKAKAKQLKYQAAGGLAMAGLTGAAAHLEGKSWERMRDRYSSNNAERAREWARQQEERFRSGGRRAGGPRPSSYKSDPFSDLGVNENASDDEIKRAWKKAMAQHHPDRGGDPEKAKNINSAFQEIMRRRGRKDCIYADGFSFHTDDLWL